jgi:hypothetical protein
VVGSPPVRMGNILDLGRSLWIRGAFKVVHVLAAPEGTSPDGVYSIISTR